MLLISSLISGLTKSCRIASTSSSVEESNFNFDVLVDRLWHMKNMAEAVGLYPLG